MPANPPEYYSLERNRDVIKTAIHALIDSRSNWDNAHTHSQATAGHEPIADVAETLAGLLADKTVSPAGLKAVIDDLKDGVSGAFDTLVEIETALAGKADAVHNHDSAYIAQGDITEIVQITQAAYDLLSPPNASTLYLIIG